MPSGMETPARRWLAAARCAVPQVHVMRVPAAPAPPGSHRTRGQCDRPGGVTREVPRDGSGVHTPTVHRQPPCPWVVGRSACRRPGRLWLWRRPGRSATVSGAAWGGAPSFLSSSSPHWPYTHSVPCVIPPVFRTPPRGAPAAVCLVLSLPRLQPFAPLSLRQSLARPPVRWSWCRCHPVSLVVAAPLAGPRRGCQPFAAAATVHPLSPSVLRISQWSRGLSRGRTLSQCSGPSPPP